MPAGLGSLFWFGVVLALIPLALWLLKRTPVGQAGAPGTPRSVAVLPLSTSQRVVTVEVGRGEHRLWLVLGVGPQGISTLHTMVPADDAPLPHASPAATFAPLLERLRKGPRDPDAL